MNTIIGQKQGKAAVLRIQTIHPRGLQIWIYNNKPPSPESRSRYRIKPGRDASAAAFTTGKPSTNLWKSQHSQGYYSYCICAYVR